MIKKKAMKNKKIFNNDPTKFFLYQEKISSEEDKKKAHNFSKQVFNAEVCPLCQKNYDLAMQAPRILIHCGHTLCTSCLYLFFKDQRIRCPLCLKLVKRIRLIETLPLNHKSFENLIRKLPSGSIDPSNRSLKLPSQLMKDLEDKDIDYPICHIHQDRFQHFMSLKDKVILCRVCILENVHEISDNLLDLYLIKQDIAEKLIKCAKENKYVSS